MKEGLFLAQTQLYLIRHGQTDWNLRSALQGRTDIPLNETGRRQALEARERLAAVKFDGVYSSPLQRAVETAQLVSGWPKEKICADQRLIEIAFGPYEGKDPHILGPEFAHFFADPVAYHPPEGGESLQSLMERTMDFLNFAAREHAGQTLLVAGHGASLHAMLTAALADPLEKFWSVSLDNCRVAVLARDENAPGGWRLAASDGDGAGEYAKKYLG